MMDCLCICSIPSRLVLIEKHWFSKHSEVVESENDDNNVSVKSIGGLGNGSKFRQIIDTLVAEIKSLQRYTDAKPVQIIDVNSESFIFLTIVHRNLAFISCVRESCQSNPMQTFEIMGQIISVFQQYFGENLDEYKLRDNFSTVYLLFEEMLFNGMTLTMDLNTLQNLVYEPSIGKKVAKLITPKSASSVAEFIPRSAVSTLSWRTRGLIFNQNEVFIDIVEALNLTYNTRGSAVHASINGQINVRSSLTGMPELILALSGISGFLSNSFNTHCFSLHKSIKLNRFERENLLSFIPPDGKFTLMDYNLLPDDETGLISRDDVISAMPIYCKPQIVYKYDENSLESYGMLSILVGIKPTPSSSSSVEDVVITIRLQASTLAVNTQNISSKGKVKFDENSKTLTWKVGSLRSDSSSLNPKLDCKVVYDGRSGRREEILGCTVEFSSERSLVSGIEVQSLTLQGVSYKPFKGVKTKLVGGRISIRF